MHKRVFMMVAAASWLSAGAFVQAQGPDLSLRPAYLDDAAPAAEDTTFDRPLMSGLKLIGMETLMRNAHLNLFGYVEGSFTHNFDQPDEGNIENKGRFFDWKNNKPLFNQVDISLERLPDTKQWDVGGRFDLIYGSDARWIHANGLSDHHNDDIRPPNTQWDLNQAYVNVNVPFGFNGLQILVGKFVTLAGAETIDPTQNVFFSHDFLFNFAIPFTHTGILATYQINKELTVKGGVSRGWDQANKDNNKAVDVLGQVAWANDQWSAAVNFIVGPEQTDNTSHYRTMVDVVVSYTPNETWKFTLNPDYIYETQGAPTGQAQWYGAAAYATYTANRYISVSGRGEWFRDNDGVRYLAEGQPFANTGPTGLGVGANFYSLTLGASYTPFPDNKLGKNLKIRPEVRYDFSDRHAFDDQSQHQQVTVGFDVFFQL